MIESTSPGFDLTHYPVLDDKTKEAMVKKKAKMSRTHAKQNMIYLFGQEVMLIPINKNASIRTTPEADDDDEAEEADPEPVIKREDLDSVVASTDRAAIYDEQLWMMHGVNAPWSIFASAMKTSMKSSVHLLRK